MNTHMEQLEQWWNSAEAASPQEGDTIIYRESRPDGTHYYGLEVVEEDFAGDSNTRILHRAPKPKPAWHDAVAVIAHTEDDEDRRALGNNGDGLWIEFSGVAYDTDDLIDPVPLIEARVTEGMVQRLEEGFNDAARASLPPGIARRMLTAALGLDNE